MYNFEYYDKVVDYIYEAAKADVTGAVELYEYESVFLEEGESSGFFAKLLKSIRTFFDRIRKVVSDFFDRKEVAKLKDADVPAKVKISTKNQKLIDEGKVTLKALQKCKTSADVEKAMTAYRRKKAAIKAGTTAVVITGAAALLWFKGKKDKELAEYKKQQIALEKKLHDQKKQALEEAKRLSKEIDDARTEAREAWAKLNAKEKEAKKLAAKDRNAVRRGNMDGYAAIVNAEQEVINDSVKATIGTGKEIITGLLSGNGVVGKAKAVAGAVSDHGDKIDAAKQKKLTNVKSDVDKTHELGQKLKRRIEAAISVLNNPNASKEKQDKAWEILKKYSPAFHQVGGKYAIIKSYWTSQKFKNTVEKIRKTKSIPD